MQQLQEVRQQQQQPREKYDQLQQQLQRTKICIPQHPGPRKKIRSKVSEDHRQEILSTPLPPSLAVRKRHRARVAVKTVQDLRHYIEFVGSLCETHKTYYGHKKAIGELISVSANRINEWLKIWSASNDPQYMTDEVKKIMSHSKISTLSSLVSALHRSGWSPENTLLPTSFPAVKYTKVENIPLMTPHVSAVAEKYHYSYEESFFDDFNNSGFSRVESSPFDLSPESIYSSSLPDENVDIDIELGLGLSQDIENWFDIVERNFEETPDMKSNLSPHTDSTVV